MKPLIPFAKRLRKRSTDTEKYLWKYLRAKRFLGLKFRRQEPIGKYIADFVCYQKRVIIECDGGQHFLEIEKDKERDRWFEEQGYRVLRFWDNDILQNLEGVMETIRKACESSPSPYNHPLLIFLPPRGGGIKGGGLIIALPSREGRIKSAVLIDKECSFERRLTGKYVGGRSSNHQGQYLECRVKEISITLSLGHQNEYK